MKKHPSPLRRAVGLVLTLLLTLGYFSPTQQALRALPASLRLTQDEPISLLTGMLRASGEGLEVSASQDETLSQYVSVTGQKSGTSELLLSILGIPLRRVEVEVSPEKRLIPGGQALGVAMRTDGVLIVGLSDVKKGVCPARDCGLQPGDVLLRIGGHAIERVADVSEIAQQNGTSPLLIEYMRDGTTAHATLTPVQDDATGVVRLGAWVRDSTAGIGTLSFYDPDSGQYAALGHAITDGDTGSILTVREGRVLKASIVAVQKGQRGVPGELKGSFLQNAAVLGDIAQNTALGISGTLTTAVTNPLYPDGLPVGTRADVHTGPAHVRPYGRGDHPQHHRHWRRTGIYCRSHPRQPAERSRRQKHGAARDRYAPAGRDRRHRAGHERQPHHPRRQADRRGDARFRQRPDAGVRAVCGLDAVADAGNFG